MDKIIFTGKWLNSDLQQSKIMFGYGLIMLLSSVLFFAGKDVFLKGAAIPIVLLSLLFCFYGANAMRKYLESKIYFQVSYQANKQNFIKTEESRLIKLSKTYAINKIIWLIVILTGSLICMLTPNNYVKGIGLGLVLFGASAFIADSFFDYSVKKYLQQIVKV